MTSYRPPYPPPLPPPPSLSPSVPPSHQPYSYLPPHANDPPSGKGASKQKRAHHRPHHKTEEERRLRKKRDVEKQRQKEKPRQPHKPSVVERKPTTLLTENRLKKPSTFMCKFKFWNELPDQTAPLKLMTIKPDKDQYTNYSITSLERQWKPRIFPEPDLGIPLDLLDLSIYNPPKVKTSLVPEDEALLRDDDVVTPIKKDGILRRLRPSDLNVSWLVKTQYISSINNESTRQSLTEKQAKELRGVDILNNLDNRERQIKDIEASFEASKSKPVHATNKNLHPVEVLPLLPNFHRYNDQFVVANFHSAPTADSEIFGKLNSSIRDEYESRAVLKSYVVAGSDSTNPDKFLAYMVPSLDETSKDMHDENEDMSYTWVREYHWDVPGGNDISTYLVSFDKGNARYLPLPTKLNLRKKRAREGRSDEIEHFPVPSRVTVRCGSTVSVMEHKDSGVYVNSRVGASGSKMRRLGDQEGLGSRSWKHDANYQYSDGNEDDYSE